MHYPLHLTVLCAGLWILQDGANAAKPAVNSEVLTVFAKNVASILSSILLGEFQASSPNQTLITHAGPFKKVQELQSLLDDENVGSESSEIPLKNTDSRYERHKRQHGSSNEEKDFQNSHITSETSQYSKYHTFDSYKPYELIVNREVSPDSIARESDAGTENINADNKDNSIDADIDAASLHYSNQYHYPGPLNPPNHYRELNFYPGYHRTPGTVPGQPSDAARLEDNADENADSGNPQLPHRPYNFRYDGPPHPFHPPFQRQENFYHPYNGPRGNGQPSIPGNTQDESNPPRFTDDQSQGQTALPGYGYHSHFHYRPYHDGLYGPANFPHHLFNGSFNLGVGEPQGENIEGGQPPAGRNNFHGYGFNHYPHPYYPNFHGYRGPAQPQNPPGNSENVEQGSSENGQPNVNSTGNRPPYGFPPFNPFYGDFHLHGYPVVPFPISPYHRFGPVFHDHLIPRFKGIPHFHSYPHFPLIHPLYGGYYHNRNSYGPSGMPENPMKPAQAEKTSNAAGNAEAPMSTNTEEISESKDEIIRTIFPTKYEKFSVPLLIMENNEKNEREAEAN